MTEIDNLQNADGNEKVTPENQVNTEEVVTETVSQQAVNEKQDNEVVPEDDQEAIDYSSFSLQALADALDGVLKTDAIQSVKQKVESIKNEFNTKFDALLDEKKEEFISEGGNEIDFHYSTPVKQQFKKSYTTYRGRLKEYYNDLEKSLKNNLSKRLEIIDAIKALIDSEDGMHSRYQQFKELQDQWRNAGKIPRDKYNNAWNSYHFNVKNFYDLLHLDRGLRDKDYQRNLEQKTKIIEQAEELAKSDNINRAFRELQALHKLWKEDLGPVPKEQSDAIWERFKAASKLINDKRQAYFSQLDELYEKNLEVKREIIQSIKEKVAENIQNHSDWQKQIKAVEALREAFFQAGKVPIKVNEATWAEFKQSVRDFNSKKNTFYKDLKKDQVKNLEKKLELIAIAEANKDSDDFEVTTPLMKKIQNDWKAIGHVPRKDSDRVWNQFKTACNGYFDRVHKLRDQGSPEEAVALQKKEELLEKVTATTLSGDKEADLKTIKDYIKEWKEIGRVHFKKRKIETDFGTALDAFFKTLDINKNEAELIKFDNKLQELATAKSTRDLDNEMVFIKKKVSDLRGEINQLENNLQFFTNVKDDNPLVKDVHHKIAKYKEDLKLWSSKLKKIRSMYS